MLAAEIGAGVERMDQSFRSGKACEQVGILRRQVELLLLDGGDGALLLDRRARIEVLLQRPVSVQAEAKIRMLRDELHGFIDDAGHFEKLAIIFPAQFAQSKFVLGALQQWQFRPAEQNGQSTAVEVLLIIPEETE